MNIIHWHVVYENKGLHCYVIYIRVERVHVWEAMGCSDGFNMKFDES